MYVLTFHISLHWRNVYSGSLSIINFFFFFFFFFAVELQVLYTF